MLAKQTNPTPANWPGIDQVVDIVTPGGLGSASDRG